MSATTVEIKKNNNESTVSLLRRFTKRVQGAGTIRRVRSIRWSQRQPSDYKVKKSALVKIARRKEFEVLKKLGKLPEPKAKGKR